MASWIRCERKVETILSDMADASVFGYELAQPAA